MKVIFVVGPTASGKSQLALSLVLSLAEKSQAAIFNCDSIQSYQGLNIGSAKPSPQELEKVPHFLFDHVPLGQLFTAGQYQREFFFQLEAVKNQFQVVFVVGGTGFYFQAIEKGMYSIGAADPETILKVETEILQAGGPEKLFQELQARDPETALKISLNDHYRLARAIEMMRTHQKPVSEIKKEFNENAASFPHPLLKLGLQLSKEELFPRVEARADLMLKTGLLEEVRRLREMGLGSWAPMQSVGYRECQQFLDGEIRDLSALREKVIQATMKLAKKQRTWFRRDPQIHWLKPEDLKAGQALIKTFLNSADP